MCYLYTTYPLHVAIKRLFSRLVRQCELHHSNSTLPFNPSSAYYVVSLISALERTMAFGFSGSPCLFIRRAMDELGLSRGILDYGFPWLNTEIVMTNPFVNPRTNASDFFLSIEKMFWPKDKDGYVIQMSQKSIRAQYSAEFAQVSDYT